MPRLQPPAGYSAQDASLALDDLAVRSVMVEVAVGATSAGFRVIVIALGEKGEKVGVQLDLEDVDAVAACGKAIRQGRFADA